MSKMPKLRNPNRKSSMYFRDQFRTNPGTTPDQYQTNVIHKQCHRRIEPDNDSHTWVMVLTHHMHQKLVLDIADTPLGVAVVGGVPTLVHTHHMHETPVWVTCGRGARPLELYM